jgi:hypothetical protein
MIIGNAETLVRQLGAQIDEVRVYTKALSPDDVAELFESYDLDIQLYPEGVVAYWKLDGDAKDVVGLSDGTLVKGDASVWVAGNTGQALDLGATTDTAYIEVPSNEVNDFDSTTSFSISLLYKIPDLSMNRELIFKGYTSTKPEVPGSKGCWIAMAYNSDNLRFFIDDNTNKSQLDNYGIDKYLHQGDWNHIVAVRDLTQDSMKMYLNGMQIGSREDITDLDISSGPLPWIIGAGGGKNAKNDGAFDEVYLYDVALSAAEIAELSLGYGIKIKELSDDATLSDLQVDGTTVEGFASDKADYAVELPEGTTTVPTVTAITTEQFAAAKVTAAAELPGTTTIDVTAADGKATMAYKIDFSVVTGLNDANSSMGLNIYPNPITDQLFIENESEISRITIYNTNGTVMISQQNVNSKALVLQLDELNSGLYLIKVVSVTNDVINKTFVKK